MVWKKCTKHSGCIPKEDYKIGDFVNVKINSCTSATLIGEAIGLSENN